MFAYIGLTIFKCYMVSLYQPTSFLNEIHKNYYITVNSKIVFFLKFEIIYIQYKYLST